MIHGGEIYDKKIELDFSVSLNPYPCPDAVYEAIREASLHVSEYPDLTQRAFREKVARAENRLAGRDYVTSENVLGGNGASELIMGIIRLIAPGKVLMPMPCFYGYYHGLKACSDITVTAYHLREETGFALGEDFIDLIHETTDMVILGNPNNPTGRIISPELLEKLVIKCSETNTALLMDECFLYLSENAVSASKYLGLCDRLFIVNAYTKLFSIPGVRVGYALAGEKNIEALNALLPEWNLSAFAQRAGEACADVITGTDYVEKSRSLIRQHRQQMISDFQKKGLEVYPSDTNFVLVKSSRNLYEFFLEKGILIRDCSNFEGLERGFYRIAVKDGLALAKMNQFLSEF